MRNWRDRASLSGLMLLAVLGGGASSPGTADRGDLAPLAAAGRILHFRARSSVENSRPGRPPRPQVGYLFSTLVLESEAPDELRLREENFVYGADGRSLGQLSSPVERRDQVLRLHRESFELTASERTASVRIGPDRYGPPKPLPVPEDGFGLGPEARSAAWLFTRTLPRALFRRLAEGETLEKMLDADLVATDVPGELVVRPAAGTPSPGTRKRLRGRVTLRPRGRDRHFVDRRFPLPPGAEIGIASPYPDRRVSLPVFLVEVETELEIETLGRPERHIRRRDRLTLSVLDDQNEPWLLAWDGRIEAETGAGSAAIRQQAFISRHLYRLDEPEAP